MGLLLRRVAVILLAVASPAAFAQSTEYTFEHLAGTTGGAGWFDGFATTARFLRPAGVASDSAGNLYVADQYNHTIRKITPAGMVQTLAGTPGYYGYRDAGGSAAVFDYPTGVAADAGGNVYVADEANHAIRKITPDGVVTTLAGGNGYGAADGTGSAALFHSPDGVAVDAHGNVFVADTQNHAIRKITFDGVVTTFAGHLGTSGIADGTGTAAYFNQPAGIALDSGGNVYVADTGSHCIRKITSAGVVTNLAGHPGWGGSTDGTGTNALFGTPKGIAVAPDGSLYVADPQMQTIRKVTQAGVVTTVAGTAANATCYYKDGAAATAQFCGATSLTVDSSGNVYIADQYNNVIRKLSTTGTVSSPYGHAADYGSVDGGAAARFYAPNGVARDSAGNLYVADTVNQTIRKVSIGISATVSTLAGLPMNNGSADGTGSDAHFNYPTGVAVDSSGNVFVVDQSNQTIRKVTSAGVVTTLAGSVGLYGSTDGNGSAARFYNPTGIAIDSSGYLYVGDSGNHVIRKISPAGNVTTFAGTAGMAGSTDATGTAARFYNPTGVAVDTSGNVYVADSSNQTIRRITPAGVVTTIAGMTGQRGWIDAIGTAAKFWDPKGVAVDGSGNVYVADSGSGVIRMITSDGTVTTIAGWGGCAGQNQSTDGTGWIARFSRPFGIASDPGGTLYVVDPDNHALLAGRRAQLSDAATIDSSTGVVNVPRQLGVTPQTASSFLWRIVTSPPTTSGATFSNANIAAPVFTPDGAGHWDFLLRASGSGGVRYSIVSLDTAAAAVAAPTGLVATATSSVSVGLVWNAVSGATYQLWRREANGTWWMFATTSASSYSDGAVAPNHAYIYRVSAVKGIETSGFSNTDIATTVMFDDEPLASGTVCRAVHLSQLRTAVSAVAALAGVPIAAFTDDPIVPMTTLIRAVHIQELRTALDTARAALGLTAVSYTGSNLTGATLRTVHIQELRNGVK